MSKIHITQGEILAALTFVVGQVVAFVPSIASDQEILISAGSSVVAAVLAIAHAIRYAADSKATKRAPKQT